MISFNSPPITGPNRMPPIIATITELRARPCRSGSQPSITRRVGPMETPSASPIKALAATHCQRAVEKIIHTSDATSRRQPDVIRCLSQPRSASGTSQRLPKRVMANGMPASRPRDQVGKPNRS